MMRLQDWLPAFIVVCPVQVNLTHVFLLLFCYCQWNTLITEGFILQRCLTCHELLICWVITAVPAPALLHPHHFFELSVCCRACLCGDGQQPLGGIVAGVPALPGTHAREARFKVAYCCLACAVKACHPASTSMRLSLGPVTMVTYGSLATLSLHAWIQPS